MSAILGTFSPSSKCIPSFNPDMAKTEEENHKNNNGGGGETSDGHETEKLSREFSCTSVCSTEHEDNGEEEETDVETDRELELGPQFTLKEQLEKDKDDESLRRWKEQLLGSVDLSAVGETLEPDVQILSLTILSPDRPDLVLPIPFEPNAKGYAFSLKDGSRYHLKFSFRVSNNIVSGLKYTNTVWKTGVRVENTKLMLGTFSPQQEPYTYELEEETTPSGMFARGSYSARTKFVDDDGKCYLDINYFFEIRKEWPSS
ncbi:RHO protein GDP dissociation inhibitor [Macleaya cordata]|uniref:RHO protein GDP dissociation inhibitor n=1 Tax=Macleaya cordata TaxID=56857 RepID=A0A200R0G8_MACCD|nr:RHO protein GDP dissociation inhibitor [Macleaya cordata]